jgi:hypothetical protein
MIAAPVITAFIILLAIREYKYRRNNIMNLKPFNYENARNEIQKQPVRKIWIKR